MTIFKRPVRFQVEFATGTLLASVLMSTLACGSSQSPVAEAGPVASNTRAPAEKDEVSLSANALRASGITVAPVETEVRTASFETPAVLQLNEQRTSRIGSLVDGFMNRLVKSARWS